MDFKKGTGGSIYTGVRSTQIRTKVRKYGSCRIPLLATLFAFQTK